MTYKVALITFFVHNEIVHLLKKTAGLYLHFEKFSHVKIQNFDDLSPLTEVEIRKSLSSFPNLGYNLSAHEVWLLLDQ